MPPKSKKTEVLLWTVQIVLSLLFIFAGSMKFILPPAVLQQGSIHLSLSFIRFIGVAEIFGALGLVLPGLFRIHRELTPVAAVGLVIIMTGATVLTILGGSVVGALFPFGVGALAVTVFKARGGVASIFAPRARRDIRRLTNA